MIIKKFVGKTEEEAVEAAKKELGNNVVIMNVKDVKRKGLFAAFRSKLVEVTVALEEEQDTIAKARREIAPAVSDEPVSPISNKGMQQSSMNMNPESIEKKLDSLQKLLEEQLLQAKQKEENTESDSAEMPENKEETVDKESLEQEKFIRLLYNTMIDNEVDEKYANQILEEIDRTKKPNIPIDYILANVYQKLILKFGKSEGITTAEHGPKVVVFMGPTGVGKTTTIAKVASSFVMDDKQKIAMLTSDTYRIAAAEQLRIYANILEVPFRVIYTEEELRQAIVDFGEYDYIFLDTTGHSHQNEEQLAKMKSFLDVIDDMAVRESFLVLSATTKYCDLLKIAQNYKAITDYQLIFTKLDETTMVGNLLNVKLCMDAPIAYITNGQNVPADIEQFNAQKMVKQLLGGNH